MTARHSGPPLARFLALRLVLIAAVVFVVNSIAVGIYYGSDRRALEAEVVSDQAERIAAALTGADLPEDAQVRALYADHPAAYAFALVDRGGTLRDAMNPALIPPGALDLYADDWITRLDRPGLPLVVAGHEFAGRADGLRMVFVMTDDPAGLIRRAFVAELNDHVWLPILPLVLLLVLANTVLIRRGLAPIAAAAAWARDLAPGNPTPPPDAPVPAEIADLVEATQRSLDRLSQALAAEKRLAAEAAHALRTPLAVLVARLDALPPGDVTDRLRGDLAALSRTVGQVLASARADGLRPAPDARTDLRDRAEAVTAVLAPFAHDRGVELTVDLPVHSVRAAADPEGVDLALTNLIENAIVHGGAGRVDIRVGPGPAIRVRDHGPGLPEDGAARLFDPFWRGAGAAPGGAGLGLAIVDRVQRAQGGGVTARNAPGGGAEFTLDWPAAET